VFDLFGLDHASELLYRLLLRRPDLDEAQLARELELPAEVVSDAIGTLKRLALVRPSWDDPQMIHPVGPEVGLGSLLAHQEAELAQRRRALERARANAAGFAAEYSRWRATDARAEVELVIGMDATRNRIQELAGAARREIMAVHVDTVPDAAAGAQWAIDPEVLDRGVTLCSVYLESRIKNHPPTRSHTQSLVERGAQVRSAPVLPPQMAIFDRATALVPIDPESSAAGTMMLSGAGVLSVLTYLFTQTWAEAAPINGGTVPPPVEQEELGETDRAVLRLLAQGLTDETVARRLGVSLRTVRRLMARLMRQLNANSRFAAGVRVAELGLMRSGSLG
jgi:DNA-binding CsgD family transcriptional regulator/sugar-specific transcriptional regulator TrmB